MPSNARWRASGHGGHQQVQKINPVKPQGGQPPQAGPGCCLLQSLATEQGDVLPTFLRQVVPRSPVRALIKQLG